MHFRMSSILILFPLTFKQANPIAPYKHGIVDNLIRGPCGENVHQKSIPSLTMPTSIPISSGSVVVAVRIHTLSLKIGLPLES